MNLTKYKHTRFTRPINKKKIPITEFNFDRVDEFNKIYFYAKKNFRKVKSTKSQAISNKRDEALHERYLLIRGNQRFELIIICFQGCYRFILQNKKAQDNVVGGRVACREMYKCADKHNIDLSKYLVSSEEGYRIKQEIEAPHIEVLQKLRLNKVTHNVYHLDFKSSYASRIVEEYPELREMYEDIYNHRKENNGYYKHILTNSIGAFQSQYCVDYKTRFKTTPYVFSKLSKVAINGTRAKIEYMIEKLKKANCVPLLTNTDGIWYWSDSGPYHDRNEGEHLGQWENDHKDCDFLMISKGAYQYVEDGVCHTVVRGLCKLDLEEPNRDKWLFGDILKIDNIFGYNFDEERGVYRDE
jgi:hypothetical protein